MKLCEMDRNFIGDIVYNPEYSSCTDSMKYSVFYSVKTTVIMYTTKVLLWSTVGISVVDLFLHSIRGSDETL